VGRDVGTQIEIVFIMPISRLRFTSLHSYTLQPTPSHMQKGFTLIELLISLFIVGIITAMGVGSFVSYNETKKLNVEAKNLAMRISEIKVKAFSGASVDGAVPQMFGVEVLPTAADAYTLFADNDGNCAFGSGDAVVEKVTLTSGVNFTGLGNGKRLCYKARENRVCLFGGVCDQVGSTMLTLSAKGKTAEVHIDLSTGMAKVFSAK